MNSSSVFVLVISIFAIIGITAGADLQTSVCPDLKIDDGAVSVGADPQTRICPNLKVANGGCIRYVQSFDITGVVTEVDLTFPEIQDVCDCIQQCLNRPTTCATWVYKFSTAASQKSGHRTCTLYSQFNLPSEVVITIDLKSNSNKNINAGEITELDNNPQLGSTVPEAFQDPNLNTTIDGNAYSGPVWQLSNGQVLC